MINKRAQVTIFIIIAILIVAAIVGYYLLRGRVTVGEVPREVVPVYEYFISCVEDETKLAVSLMGSQAGYLQLPEFEAGNTYYPSSSHLNFLGYSVPYWYYVSGNGIAKEQIPSKDKMQAQLEEYLEEILLYCDFSDFETQGFVIDRGDLDVGIVINEREIEVEVDMPLDVSFGDVSGRQVQHSVSVDSQLGKFYDIARDIYEKENAEMFLENYGVDILRLYAPVDGVEVTCSPKVWEQDDIKEDLREALEGNTAAIKVKGSYYVVDEEDKYFIQNIGEEVGGEGEFVNFMYSSQWPTKIEIHADDPMVAEPVGLEEGFGMLGFCYVPYHFVYDLAYPVLIQIHGAGEMFQFPMGVIIDKNKAREAVDVQGLPQVVPELCEHKLTEMTVYTYNNKLDPVEAQIKYKCFDTSCYIGETATSGADAGLIDKFPQCVNGFIIASAEGYKTKKYLASTVRDATVSIILDKKYALSLEVQKDRRDLGDDYAIVTFSKDETTRTVFYPEQKEIELTEGQYEIKVYIYSNSTISLEGSTTEKCVDVPRSGILGVFGASEEKCFTLEIPDQVVSFAVSGGGKQDYFATESELESGKVVINARGFPLSTKVEDLQTNYNNVEINGLDMQFG